MNSIYYTFAGNFSGESISHNMFQNTRCYLVKLMLFNLNFPYFAF